MPPFTGKKNNKKGVTGKWFLCGNKILTECFSVFGRGYSKQFFKCLAQMKFVIKSIVQCDFPQGGFRLGKKKLTNHFSLDSIWKAEKVFRRPDGTDCLMYVHK